MKGHPMNKNRILIVEDEESLLKLESILLSSKGYQVFGATDGRTALGEVDHIKPDLILLDIMLPELDGFEVCRLIKVNPETSGIPVVMLSAKKNRQDIERGAQVGADAYVTKPFKSAKVIEVIESLINRVPAV
jgi:twitching motility two-component system response regulator PilG